MTAGSLRARVRAQMTEEIKTIARQHLASDGANLSLRAVARDLGVVSSAIYRYFASRDDLLTALIVDAYSGLGAAVEAADAGVPRDDVAGRWLALCHAVRDWALAAPHEYALIYGSPVPGYRAPADTTAAATRAITVFGGILQHATALGRFPPDGAPPAAGDGPLPAPVAESVARIGALIGPDVPPAALSRGVGAWVLLFGMVSFELFGQFDNVVADRRALFDHQMREQAAYLGLGSGTRNGP